VQRHERRRSAGLSSMAEHGVQGLTGGRRGQMSMELRGPTGT
jgi:hypothetical protein